MKNATAISLVLVGAWVAVAAQAGFAQAFEIPENPLPPLENIQPADTPTLFPKDDEGSYPATEYFENMHRPPERHKRGMLKKQYRRLPDHDWPPPVPMVERDTAPLSLTEPATLPPQAAPGEGERQRHRPDLRERERPNGLGRFIQSPDPALPN